MSRYLGNKNSKEFHDLDNQQGGCQIAKIKVDNIRYFDTAAAARRAGYDPCGHCQTGSTR